MDQFVAEWIMSGIRHLNDKKQFGSFAGLSTTHALLPFAHHLYNVTDQLNQCARILLLDFCKAFDRIYHNILLNKMNRMGIDHILSG